MASGAVLGRYVLALLGERISYVFANATEMGKQHRNFAVGDIVLILDDKTPCSLWPLGQVLEVHANSNDGLVRSVMLKTRSSELVRPITKIVLLEEADIHQNDK